MLSLIKQKIRYSLWRLSHPKGKFSDYYVETVAKRIGKVGTHETLSVNARNPDRYRKTAQLELNLLIGAGLQKSDRLIDYGCGTLRFGREAISWLNSGCYVGFDISSEFFSKGLSAINSDLVVGKKPLLLKISKQNIEEESLNSADYVVSFAVLYHIPTAEIMEYFVNILSLLKSEGFAFIDFSLGSDYVQTGPMTWDISEEYLSSILSKLNVKWEILRPNSMLDSKLYSGKHRILRIQKL